jgi:superfamily II DNA or RNA helicase
MPVSFVLARQFPASIRRRGAEYHRQGKVGVTLQTDTILTAQVRGTRPYIVTIENSDDSFSASCTCPFSARGDGPPCKHIWATLLEADEVGFALPESSEPVAPPAPIEEDGDDEFVDNELNAALASWGYGGAAPSWRDRLGYFDPAMVAAGSARTFPTRGEVLYELVSPAGPGLQEVARVRLLVREPKLKGGWCKAKRLRLDVDALDSVPEAMDREILAALAGAADETYSVSGGERCFAESYRLTEAQIRHLLPTMVATGRCLWAAARGKDGPHPVAMDPHPAPWHFRMVVSPDGRNLEVGGVLQREAATRPLREAALILGSSWVLWPEGLLAPLEVGDTLAWLKFCRHTGELQVPVKEADRFLETMYTKSTLPPLDLPDSLRVEQRVAVPKPCLRVSAAKEPLWGGPAMVSAALIFDYDGVRIEPHRAATLKGLFRADERVALRRDAAAERAQMDALRAAGFRPAPYGQERDPYEIPASKLSDSLIELIERGWRIESAGKAYRTSGTIAVDVRSGVDWFDVRVQTDFGGVTAPLPALLAALKRGERTVVLADGSIGVVTEDFLRKLGPLLRMGAAQGEQVRFSANQAGILDALLAAQPAVTCDETFRRVRDELRTFTSVTGADAPVGFRGELRPYQREGLGWFHFLRRFHFGGCLADDMGLGKTVQVLALLEQRRQDMASAGERRPSLVVMPKSLIFNWKQEAARFVPNLRVVDHTGTERVRAADVSGGADVVLTTYGTMRRDIAHLSAVEFDYVVLDEAQAIKNASAQTTKAARLLKGRHRLALSGTPIQNHLGELWSLFEFLNPGMLGAAAAFRIVDGASWTADPEARVMLAKALRPFILRRTKGEVARDLPPRTEETIHCELDTRQRKAYDQLKLYYQQSLLKRVSEQGLAKSKILVLEALLRLRQAACHTGLLDPSQTGEGSAKLDLLMDRLAELAEEGHKALVFSQFTSFLAIVRDRLKAAGIGFVYLDGKTRDRQAPVEQFQRDPAISVFLISLTAGGLGLNLTAAEYVFLLDPWWNPAVEMQAMDRAHRIGQTRQVFVYRLIAQGTVEEKVLELQQTKRELADAIITADNSLLRTLTRDDLERLLA